MNNIFAIVMIFALMFIPGCVHDTQEETLQPANQEINPNPILLPTNKLPEISDHTDGIRFIWPDQDWFLMSDESGVNAVASDLSSQVSLQPKRRQVQEIPLPMKEEEATQEAFMITDVIQVKEGLLLVTKHQNGLYGFAHLRQITDEKLEWLIRDSDEHPQYLISQDMSKVIFRKLPEGHLSAYHTITGRITAFPSLDDNQFCSDWMEHINISPLGGYLTYEVMDCTTGHPIQFIIVGADSGRIIHDHLPGENPGWDHADQQIVFQLIEGDSTSSSNESEKLRLQQLGRYSLLTNDIVFFNRIANGLSLYRVPRFSEDNAYLIYPVRNKQESRLIIHHITQQLQQSLLLPEGTEVAEIEQWSFMNEKTLIMPIRAETGYQLFIHHVATELTEIIGPIDYWKNEDGSIKWFYSDSSYVFYLKDGRLMQAQDGSHRSVFTLSDNITLSGINIWQDWLLITVVTSHGEQQLYFVSL